MYTTTIEFGELKDYINNRYRKELNVRAEKISSVTIKDGFIKVEWE